MDDFELKLAHAALVRAAAGTACARARAFRAQSGIVKRKGREAFEKARAHLRKLRGITD